MLRTSVFANAALLISALVQAADICASQRFSKEISSSNNRPCVDHLTVRIAINNAQSIGTVCRY
jgi:hypothetical protein